MKSFFSVSLLAGVIISKSLWAWGDLGHQTVAEIADRHLKENTRQFIQGIVGPDPLAVGAIFPDIVRSHRQFNDFAPFHYVEIPFGETYATKPKVKRDGNAIIKARHLLKDKKISREHKMLLVRYLIHVVGDLHQPLHVGNGRDLGANLCDVYWIDPKTKHKERLNLHSVWDENMLDYVKYVEYPDYLQKKEEAKGGKKPAGAKPKRWFGFKEFADMILDQNKDLDQATRDGYAQALPTTWYEEAQALHSKVVYPDEVGQDGKITPKKPEERLYCDLANPRVTQKEEGRIPTLDGEYAKKGTTEIKVQLFKGGLRLAHLLNELAADEKVEAVNENTLLKELLEKIDQENP